MMRRQRLRVLSLVQGFLPYPPIADRDHIRTLLRACQTEINAMACIISIVWKDLSYRGVELVISWSIKNYKIGARYLPQDNGGTMSEIVDFMQKFIQLPDGDKRLVIAKARELLQESQEKPLKLAETGRPFALK